MLVMVRRATLRSEGKFLPRNFGDGCATGCADRMHGFEGKPLFVQAGTKKSAARHEPDCAWSMRKLIQRQAG